MKLTHSNCRRRFRNLSLIRWFKREVSNQGPTHQIMSVERAMKKSHLRKHSLHLNDCHGLAYACMRARDERQQRKGGMIVLWEGQPAFRTESVRIEAFNDCPWSSTARSSVLRTPQRPHPKSPSMCLQP